MHTLCQTNMPTCMYFNGLLGVGWERGEGGGERGGGREGRKCTYVVDCSEAAMSDLSLIKEHSLRVFINEVLGKLRVFDIDL